MSHRLITIAATITWMLALVGCGSTPNRRHGGSTPGGKVLGEGVDPPTQVVGEMTSSMFSLAGFLFLVGSGLLLASFYFKKWLPIWSGPVLMGCGMVLWLVPPLVDQYLWIVAAFGGLLAAVFIASMIHNVLLEKSMTLGEWLVSLWPSS